MLTQPDLRIDDSPQFSRAFQYFLKYPLQLPTLHKFDGWIEEVALCCDQGAIFEKLRHRYSTICLPKMEEFLTFLSTFLTDSIIFYEGMTSPKQCRSWLVLEKEFADDEGALLIPPPIELEFTVEIESFVESIPDLRKFLMVFGGISETYTPSNSTFGTTFVKFYGDPDCLGRRMFDSPRILLFYSSSGEPLLVDEKGNFQWFLAPQETFLHAASSVSEFIDLYILSRSSNPFFAPHTMYRST